MSNYNEEIDGKDDLNTINLEISGEEAGASEFLGSTISATSATINNASFKELAPGTVPNDLTLIVAGGVAPAGTTQIWTGAMIVSGKSQLIVAYRKN